MLNVGGENANEINANNCRSSYHHLLRHLPKVPGITMDIALPRVSDYQRIALTHNVGGVNANGTHANASRSFHRHLLPLHHQPRILLALTKVHLPRVGGRRQIALWHNVGGGNVKETNVNNCRSGYHLLLHRLPRTLTMGKAHLSSVTGCQQTARMLNVGDANANETNANNSRSGCLLHH